MSYLEPTAEEQRSVLEMASSLVARHAEAMRTHPVATPMNAQQIRRRLAAINPETAMGHEAAIRWCSEFMRSTMVHTTSPRYFGLFNPTPAFMGIVGDLLTASFNPQLAAWSHAPGPVEIEAWLIRYLGSRLGLGPDARGAFTSGGAEANATALHLALTRAFPEFGDRGLRGVDSEPALYISTESHHAWIKIAHACGVGRDAVRHIPVRPDLTMDTDALQAALGEDRRSGSKPVLLVATAGTTSAGVIDPLAEMAQIARAHDAFFHVDAAWGGAAVLSDTLRVHLAGVEEADSVTIDAHKWMSVPMGAGMLITRHWKLLQETYRVTTEYMPDSVEATADPYTSSNQWSRRFTGLKLFLTLITVGREGYASQIEQDVRLGDYLREQLIARGWGIVNDTPLPVVCFTDLQRQADTKHHQAIVDHIVQEGEAWLSTTSVAGKPTIRACITSHRTGSDDVDRLVRALEESRTKATSCD